MRYQLKRGCYVVSLSGIQSRYCQFSFHEVVSLTNVLNGNAQNGLINREMCFGVGSFKRKHLFRSRKLTSLNLEINRKGNGYCSIFRSYCVPVGVNSIQILKSPHYFNLKQFACIRNCTRF